MLFQYFKGNLVFLTVDGPLAFEQKGSDFSCANSVIELSIASALANNLWRKHPERQTPLNDRLNDIKAGLESAAPLKASLERLGITKHNLDGIALWVKAGGTIRATLDRTIKLTEALYGAIDKKVLSVLLVEIIVAAKSADSGAVRSRWLTGLTQVLGTDEKRLPTCLVYDISHIPNPTALDKMLGINVKVEGDNLYGNALMVACGYAENKAQERTRLFKIELMKVQAQTKPTFLGKSPIKSPMKSPMKSPLKLSAKSSAGMISLTEFALAESTQHYVSSLDLTLNDMSNESDPLVWSAYMRYPTPDHAILVMRRTLYWLAENIETPEEKIPYARMVVPNTSSPTVQHIKNGADPESSFSPSVSSVVQEIEDAKKMDPLLATTCVVQLVQIPASGMEKEQRWGIWGTTEKNLALSSDLLWVTKEQWQTKKPHASPEVLVQSTVRIVRNAEGVLLPKDKWTRVTVFTYFYSQPLKPEDANRYLNELFKVAAEASYSTVIVHPIAEVMMHKSETTITTQEQYILQCNIALSTANVKKIIFCVNNNQVVAAVLDQNHLYLNSLEDFDSPDPVMVQEMTPHLLYRSPKDDVKYFFFDLSNGNTFDVVLCSEDAVYFCCQSSLRKNIVDVHHALKEEYSFCPEKVGISVELVATKSLLLPEASNLAETHPFALSFELPPQEYLGLVNFTRELGNNRNFLRFMPELRELLLFSQTDMPPSIANVVREFKQFLTTEFKGEATRDALPFTAKLTKGVEDYSPRVDALQKQINDTYKAPGEKFQSILRHFTERAEGKREAKEPASNGYHRK